MTETRIVLTSAGSADEARKIADALVDRRLAACVNIVPHIESVYRWQGKVERAGEWLLIVKTQVNAFARVKETIHALHSYEMPEVIMLDVCDGDPRYLEWIEKNTG